MGLFIAAGVLLVFSTNAYALAPGTISSWATNATTLPQTLEASSSATYNGYIYEVGGYHTGTVSTVYYAQVNLDHSVGSWSTSAHALPAALDGVGLVAANGYLYALGGLDTGSVSYSQTVYYAAINGDGSVGSWSTTTDLVTATGFGSAVINNGYIYFIGGDTPSTSDTVYYAQLNSNGTIGPWTTSSNHLPSSRSQMASVVSNGYLYVFGGFNGGSGHADVYYSKINSDASIGTWVTNTASLPKNLFTNTAVAFGGFVYVIGGNSSLNGVSSTVYVGQPDTNGSIASWSTLTNLPAARYELTSVLYNGYAYIIAGADSSNSPTDTIYYAKLTPLAPTIPYQKVEATSGKLTNFDVLSGVSNNPSSATLSIVSGPAHGTASVNTSTGIITYTSNSGYTGSDSLTYQLCSADDTDVCSQAVLGISVQVTTDGALANTGQRSLSSNWLLAILFTSSILLAKYILYTTAVKDK